MKEPEAPDFRFFAGGQDLEMQVIRDLVLSCAGPSALCDKRPGWGARASLYKAEIEESLATGKIPVLIELEPDLDPMPDKVVIVDHHNTRAGQDQPTALEQVFNLLGCPQSAWSRYFALVAANDRGWIPEMRKIGATDDEIAAIRAADRKAQGITAKQEQQAEAALRNSTSLSDCPVRIVDVPHGRFATVTDRLAQEGGTPPVLAVRGPGETGIYGPGAVIRAFVRDHPGAWYGGALPDYGFAGIDQVVAEARLYDLQKYLTR